jgi:hypothetical protein
MENCYMYMYLSYSKKKKSKYTNSGTIVVVISTKRDLDVYLSSENPHGKFQVPIWNSIEKPLENCYMHMSYNKKKKKYKGT